MNKLKVMSGNQELFNTPDLRGISDNQLIKGSLFKQVIKDLASSEHIAYSNILIDEDGIGGAVVDGLFGVRGFVANSSPLPTLMQVRERVKKLEHDLVPKTIFVS